MTAFLAVQVAEERSEKCQDYYQVLLGMRIGRERWENKMEVYHGHDAARIWFRALAQHKKSSNIIAHYC